MHALLSDLRPGQEHQDAKACIAGLHSASKYIWDQRVMETELKLALEGITAEQLQTQPEIMAHTVGGTAREQQLDNPLFGSHYCCAGGMAHCACVGMAIAGCRPSKPVATLAPVCTSTGMKRHDRR